MSLVVRLRTQRGERERARLCVAACGSSFTRRRLAARQQTHTAITKENESNRVFAEHEKKSSKALQARGERASVRRCWAAHSPSASRTEGSHARACAAAVWRLTLFVVAVGSALEDVQRDVVLLVAAEPRVRHQVQLQWRNRGTTGAGQMERERKTTNNNNNNNKKKSAR